MEARRVLYLVKWKGFPHEANTWERRVDINAKLVDEFNSKYANYGGNHIGVEHLDKRIKNGRVEYLVRRKCRPEAEKSWEKESTILENIFPQRNPLAALRLTSNIA